MSLFRRLPSLVANSRCYLRPPLVSAVPRYFSTSVAVPPDIDFEELKKKLDSNEVLLIDVRLPSELRESGMIPNARNMIVQYLGPDILLPDDKFAEKYKFEKPALDEPLVVHCLAGVRARTAQLVLLAAGYDNVRVYVGSYEDWLEKGGPVVYPPPEQSK